jgi:glycosyltransferase involved in cell wall biosynthesis
MSTRKTITVVCPVFNEEESIPIFYDRFTRAIEPYTDTYQFELLFTNNRSVDSTLDVITGLQRDDPNVYVLTLSRNFGYQPSVLAGITHAGGDAIIVIDVDCEDPPEMIPDFIKGWESGHDIVYGIRSERSESPAIQWFRKAFYRLMAFAADYETILDMAEFSLFTRQVRDHLIDNTTTFPFIRTEIAYAGFSRLGIPYKRQPRVRGKTHYNLITMTAFAIGGILSSSTFLLRLAGYLSAVLFAVNVLLAAVALLAASTMLFFLLFTLDLTYLVVFLGVASVYIARIYKDHTGRPVYIVDWQHSTYPWRGE